MALNATIYKFDINLSNLDKNYYDSFSCHIALHPSETVERMIIRLIAFCMHYTEKLSFTKGLSTESEPDIWELDYSDQILTWIDLGLPDYKRIKKACSLSESVILYTYGGQNVEMWWEKISRQLSKHTNLEIFQIDQNEISSISSQIERTMSFSCIIQDGQLSLSWLDQMQDISLTQLK